MFDILRRHTTLRQTGILRGLTDWHSHLLPGVDDGISHLDDTLRLLAHYEHEGIVDAWFTPHIMEDIPNTTAALRARFAEVQAAYDGPVRLHLAAEYMMDNLFEERLAARDLLPLGDEGTHLLVETSYFNPPMGMKDLLRRIQHAGYHPVLAHPERYTYMTDDDYTELREMQILFQLNLYSLTGMYGRTARDKARRLLRRGMIDRYGTDTHRVEQFQRGIEAKINRIEL